MSDSLNLKNVQNNPENLIDPWRSYEEDCPWARRPDFDDIVVEFELRN